MLSWLIAAIAKAVIKVLCQEDQEEEWSDEDWNEYNNQWTDEEWDAWNRTEGWGRWTEAEWRDWQNGGWAVFERWGYT